VTIQLTEGEKQMLQTFLVSGGFYVGAKALDYLSTAPADGSREGRLNALRVELADFRSELATAGKEVASFIGTSIDNLWISNFAATILAQTRVIPLGTGPYIVGLIFFGPSIWATRTGLSICLEKVSSTAAWLVAPNIPRQSYTRVE
jgi:hypothetical protein